jgi:hypothetical protein
MKNFRTISNFEERNGELTSGGGYREDGFGRLTRASLVGFARLYSRIRIIRLDKGRFLFSAHIPFLWQRVFDKFL